MPNSRSTKRLIEGKIKKISGEVASQQVIVNRLRVKLTATQRNYDNAVSKLSGLQGELSDYEKDKVK